MIARVTGLTGLFLAVTASGVMADPVDGRTARAQIFGPASAARIVRLPGLREQDFAILAGVAKSQKYYGAVAMTLDEGLLAEATVAAANFHALGPAEAAALKSCNARRKRTSSRCVIAAQIVPRGYAERAFQLNVDASEAIRTDYARGRGPKSLAISPATGQWSMAKGDGAVTVALADCNRAAQDAEGPPDCIVAVQD